MAPFSYFEWLPPGLKAIHSAYWVALLFLCRLHPLYTVIVVYYKYFCVSMSWNLSISWNSSLTCLHSFFMRWWTCVPFIAMEFCYTFIIKIQQKSTYIWSRRATRQCYYILRRPFKSFIHMHTANPCVYSYTCIRSSLQCYCCCHMSTLQIRKFKNPRKIYARGTLYFIVLLRLTHWTRTISIPQI